MFGIIALLTVLLVGCASPQLLEARKAAESASKTQEEQMAACDRAHPDKVRRPSTPRIKCINEAILAYHHAYNQSVGNKFLDLAHVMTSQTLVAAEKYDGGKISAAEFTAALALIESDFDSKVAQRKNESLIARSAAAQARAAQEAASHAGSMARRSSMPVTCSTGTTTVTCY